MNKISGEFFFNTGAPEGRPEAEAMGSKYSVELEIIPLGKNDPCPKGFQLFTDPMTPAPWDACQPQPVAVRAVMVDKEERRKFYAPY